MNNQPLSSGDQSKLIMFILLFTPSVLLFVGVIPAIFIIFGLVMMKRNKDFSYVATAVTVCNWYIGLILAGLTIFFLYWVAQPVDEWDRKDAMIASIALISCAIAYLYIINYLFFYPLNDHRDWVKTNGIFSSKPVSSKPPENENQEVSVSIIKGENFKQYSVADELIKWAKLKEEGHITESEYNEARSKLLGKNG